MAPIRVYYLLTCLILSTLTCTAYYTFDGKGNNLNHPDWGSAGSLFLREQTGAANGYGITGDITIYASVSARKISYDLTLPPYRSRGKNEAFKTDMLTFIGQFFNHDIDLRESDDTEEYNIPVEHCDFYFNREACNGTPAAITPEISMTRSAYDDTFTDTREQINTITAYLDGSVVYGSDALTAYYLRSHYRGKMAMYNNELPKNSYNLPMANPSHHVRTNELRAAGDVRANVHPILLAIQSLFLREHNRLADEIYELHPNWSDQQIYDEARKWNIAFMQSICYYEYLPILGFQLSPYTGYKSHINPGIDNFFATVSYRYGHSEVVDVILRVDDDGEEIESGHLLLMENYFNPDKGLNAGIEPLLRGATLMQQAESAPHFANALQNYLFNTSLHGGADLLALNIQRGRDHGIPFYNEARAALGLPRKQSFYEITTDVYIANQLQVIYEFDIDKVDAYVGGSAEDPYMESNVGELFYVSMLEQYTRIRDGDRFYFENENDGLFTKEEINKIRSTGLRDIIMRNTNIERLPENIYVVNIDEPWPIETSDSSLIETGDVAIDKATETLKSNVYTIEWDIVTINNIEYIEFTLECQCTGWMGIGFAKDMSSKMVEADIIVGKVESGVVTVNDYWATSFIEPILDVNRGGSNDIEVLSGSEIDGVTNIKMRRKLKTGDNENDRDIVDGVNHVIYAWGDDSDTFQYHTALRRGVKEIDFVGKLQEIKNALNDEIEEMVETSGNIIIDESNEFTFEWQMIIENEKSYLNSTLKIKRNGPMYVAMGLQEESNDKLESTDLLKITSSDEISCVIRDYWSESEDDIKLDTVHGGSDDTHDSQCEIVDGYIVANIKRLSNTEDPMDRIIGNSQSNVIFVYDDTGSDFDTNSMNKKRFIINFDTYEYEIIQNEISEAEVTTTDDTIQEEITTDTTNVIDTNVIEEEEEVIIVEPEVVLSTSGEVIVDEANEFVIGYELFKEAISFTLQIKGTGFAAIGIPRSGLNMMDADILAVVNDVSGCYVGDYWSVTFANPSEDTSLGGTDDLTDTSCAIDGDYLKASFTRSLKTDDSNDNEIIPDNFDFIYAFATAGGLVYHGPTGRGSSRIEPDMSVFSEQTTTQTSSNSESSGGNDDTGNDNDVDENSEVLPTTVDGDGDVDMSSSSSHHFFISSDDIDAIKTRKPSFIVHTIFIIIGWGILAVMGVAVAIFGVTPHHSKNIHMLIQFGTLFFVLIGEIIALSHPDVEMKLAHGILSLLLIFIILIQAYMGFISYASKSNERTSYKKAHTILGYVLVVLGYWQIWMALRLLGAETRLMQIFYAISFSILIAFHFGRQSMKNSKNNFTELKNINENNRASLNPIREDIELQNPISNTKSSAVFIQPKNDSEYIKANYDVPVPSSLPLPIFNNNQSNNMSSMVMSNDEGPSEIKKTVKIFENNDGSKVVTVSEFKNAESNGKSWTLIHGNVYDMEKMLISHPGGREAIEDIIGKDGTDLYDENHENSTSAHKMLKRHLIGELQ